MRAIEQELVARKQSDAQVVKSEYRTRQINPLSPMIDVIPPLMLQNWQRTLQFMTNCNDA